MGAAGNPARAIGRQAATRHHTVDMWMEQQVLAPRVQDRDAARLGAQMLWIGSDGAQGLGTGMKRNAIEHALILEGDRRDFLRHCKDHVEIGNRQQFGLPVFQPLRALGSGIFDSVCFYS